MAAPAVVPTEATRRHLGAREHAACFACSQPTPDGLGLRFALRPDGDVAAEWDCPNRYQSYDGMLHGGITATLLDAAMAQALFAVGVVAYTADLHVRYRHPVRIGCPVIVHARRLAQTGPLYRLAAEIRQGGLVCATADAKFMATPHGHRQPIAPARPTLRPDQAHP